MKPIIAITAGDPSGVGPEIAIKSLQKKDLYTFCTPVLIVDKPVLEKAMEQVNEKWVLHPVQNASDALGVYGTIDYIETGSILDSSYEMGKVSALCGNAGFTYVVRAIELALAGKVQAVVTGPINKEALNKAGHHFSGHTEIFAHYTNTNDFAMMLVSKTLKVIHVTTHVSMRDACKLISQERVLSTIRLAAEALKEMGIENSPIAVAGLNAHCSENGLFGTEEQDAIMPAVKQAKKEGIVVEGPIPPDTVFVKAISGQYEIVVCMYHDQGHIPLKLSGFKMDPKTKTFKSVSGINCTIGLPIIRTSVDHGTAFDIAGKGIANEESMLDAIDMAVTMAKYRFCIKQ